MLERLVSYLNYPNLDPTKLLIAIQSTVVLLAGAFLFVYIYHKFFWKEPQSRKVFVISSLILFFVMVAKFIIGFKYQGYVPELMFFYGIPSPKITGFIWLFLAIASVTLFIRFREKIERLSTSKFLLTLGIAFCLFSLSVAGLRDGLTGVAEPYTKVYWEYTGNLPEITSAKSFLHTYTIATIGPKIAVHSETHPPGYTLILYFFQKFFGAGYLGMALLTILSSALIVWPLYYTFKYFLGEIEVRRTLEIFIFVPSIVMMTATSTEVFFLLSVWTTIALCIVGWKKNSILAGLAGITAGIALLCNFLFLLLVPFFIFVSWYTMKKATPDEREKMLWRIFLSLLFFVSFFVTLWSWSGYSIIDNFFTAHAASKHVVGSNFESVPVYFMYVLMNVVNFLVYLGIPLVIIFFQGYPESFKKSSVLFKSGVALVAFFLIIGIFQANVERLWLFILPFFVVFGSKLLKDENKLLFNSFLSLTFFQMFITQVLFYTFY